MKRILFFLTGLVLVSACDPSKKRGFQVAKRDTTINETNSYSDLFLDSLSMEQYIAGRTVTDSLLDRIRSFYNHRNYQYAWFDSRGITESVSSFLNMQNLYLGLEKDSSFFDPVLSRLLDSISAPDQHYMVPDSDRLKTELELTEGFFKYADRAYGGKTSINTVDLGWFIPRKKVDLVDLLDSIAARNDKDLSNFEPVNRQYIMLRDYLGRYYDIQKKGGFTPINVDKKVSFDNPPDSVVNLVRAHMRLTGDLPATDTTTGMDSVLADAIRLYEQRHGLPEDGKIGKAMLAEMNVSVEDRIEQILINMERIRWVPANPPADYLLVNIPAYKLYVYENNALAWTMNVVVGSQAHNTVIFRGDMKYIVFSPYWNVPPSIIRNEIMPGIRRNPNYLARHQMEWFNGGVRQRPGVHNSLGLVKFLFPNSYNIYLHDTPSKSLFDENDRAFSHGCIRLGEPQKLAEYLLRNDSAWTKERIVKAMHAKSERYAPLKHTIPVFIGYFTAWVGSDGKLNFRKDVYGHDRKMEKQMLASSDK